MSLELSLHLYSVNSSLFQFGSILCGTLINLSSKTGFPLAYMLLLAADREKQLFKVGPVHGSQSESDSIANLISHFNDQ